MEITNMRHEVHGRPSGYSVFTDMLEGTVKQAHGIADRLDDLQSVLKEATLPSDAFGSSFDAKELTGDWNAAVDQRISDLKKLSGLTDSLAYKIKYVVESVIATEQANGEFFDQAVGQAENEVQNWHKPRTSPNEPVPYFGEKPRPGGFR